MLAAARDFKRFTKSVWGKGSDHCKEGEPGQRSEQAFGILPLPGLSSDLMYTR